MIKNLIAIPCTRTEIANHLQMDRKTLYYKLKKEKLMIPRGIIPADQVREIYIRLGYSSKLKEIGLN